MILGDKPLIFEVVLLHPISTGKSCIDVCVVLLKAELNLHRVELV
jgi:hypothetical protein